MEPLTGHGISDAFCDAEPLAGALDAGFSALSPVDDALREYDAERDERKRGYTWSTGVARGSRTGTGRRCVGYGPVGGKTRSRQTGGSGPPPSPWVSRSCPPHRSRRSRGGSDVGRV